MEGIESLHGFYFMLLHLAIGITHTVVTHDEGFYLLLGLKDVEMLGIVTQVFGQLAYLFSFAAFGTC